jgi:gluconate:H+ symporter, GntP family
MHTPIYIILLLALAIVAIIILSTRLRFNTFFTLLIVATTVGFAAGFEGEKVVLLLKKGMGATLEKVGLLIILGTTLGLLLEKSKATLSLANYILSKTDEKNTPVVVTFMGFLIGLPIFCDSGFIVLIGLVLSLASRMRGKQVLLVSCLAVSLYAVHCLVPPHPGISAAAGILKVDLGQAMLLGIVVSIPTTLAAYFWVKFRSQDIPDFNFKNDKIALNTEGVLPSPILSFLPIIIPIALIATKSIALLNPSFLHPSVLTLIKFIGEPVSALGVGIILSLFLFKTVEKETINNILGTAIEKSGPILAIIAMGGAFGEIIKEMNIGKVFGESLTSSGLGLLIPFVLTALFKTAQGSSTVAIMSAASIIEPLLVPLGLDSEWWRLLSLAAMGAGSMSVSHANDAYFWVTSNFGEMDTRTTLRVYSSASALMGVVAFLTIWVISKAF